SDDHAVEISILHFREGGVEGHQMLDGSVLGGVRREAKKLNLHLQRGVGEQSDQICLGGDLEWHQDQQQYFQGADILCGCTKIIHYKDVLYFQYLDRRQFVG